MENKLPKGTVVIDTTGEAGIIIEGPYIGVQGDISYTVDYGVPGRFSKLYEVPASDLTPTKAK